MMGVDDLVAAISSLQRSDLEAWIREQLVVPQHEAGTLVFSDMGCPSPPHLHAALRI